MLEAHHEWRHRHMIHKPTKMEKWNIHLRSTINLDPVFYTSAQVMIEESQRVVALYFRARALDEMSKERRYLKRVPEPRTRVSVGINELVVADHDETYKQSAKPLIIHKKPNNSQY